MGIYFDNAATTRCDSLVFKKIQEFNETLYANPASLHRFGFNVQTQIENYRSQIADLINAKPCEIFFTSGGTESNNIAIQGILEGHKKEGKNIVVTNVEHASVRNIINKYLNDYEIRYIKINNNGNINIDDLKQLIDTNTILVSIMHVNNEIGSVFDIKNIGKIIKEINKNTVFHVDNVQGFTKIKIFPHLYNVDMFSVSGHKFHGPKGVGFLYVNEKLQLKPIIFGGGQERGLRSSTLNTTGIVGLFFAMKLIYDDFDGYNDYIYNLRDYMIDSIMKLSNYKFIINTEKSDKYAPHIVSVSFENILSEVVLHSLEEKDIYISVGSACTNVSKHLQGTMTALGLDKKFVDGTLRISFSKYNTKEEIDIFIKELNDILIKLKKYIKK